MVSGSTSTPTSRRLRRHRDHVLLIVDHPLGHEAVPALDAPLGELAGEAEVGSPDGASADTRGRPQGRRTIVTTKSPGRSSSTAGADLDDLAERFVAHHEVRRSRRGRAVFDRAQSRDRCRTRRRPACAAERLSSLGAGLRMIDHAHGLVGRKHRDRSHTTPSFAYPGRA